MVIKTPTNRGSTKLSYESLVKTKSPKGDDPFDAIAKINLLSISSPKISLTQQLFYGDCQENPINLFDQ
jgi:hypothetical protein